MSKHTPGPWVTWQDPINRWWRIDKKLDNNSIIVAIGVGKEDDAKRIVACVNACAGIATDALEAVAMQGAPAQKLVEQRDKLLEALNEAADLLVDAEIPATKFLALIAEVEVSK
jgi:hypothetical protein